MAHTLEQKYLCAKGHEKKIPSYFLEDYLFLIREG
jgi:hypothetical protein